MIRIHMRRLNKKWSPSGKKIHIMAILLYGSVAQPVVLWLHSRPSSMKELKSYPQCWQLSKVVQFPYCLTLVSGFLILNVSELLAWFQAPRCKLWGVETEKTFILLCSIPFPRVHERKFSTSVFSNKCICWGLSNTFLPWALFVLNSLPL